MGTLKILGGIIDRIFIVLGAFAGSQIPAFFNQYTQRLAGHVGELGRLLADMRKNAAMTGKSLEEYIQKFLNSSDPDFALQGKFMQGIEVRWEELSTSYRHLTESSMWVKPFVFLKNIDYALVKDSLSSFQPHLSLTMEGIYYTFIGIAMGYITYQLLYKLVSTFLSKSSKFRMIQKEKI